MSLIRIWIGKGGRDFGSQLINSLYKYPVEIAETIRGPLLKILYCMTNSRCDWRAIVVILWANFVNLLESER